MTPQDVVWTIWLAGAVVVALGVIHVVVQAGKPADDAELRKAAHTSHRLQAWLFGALLVVFVVGTFATLRRFPIPSQHRALGAPQVVDVVGRQWSWQVTPAAVRAGSAVEFRVTSVDVNHGFAIYSPDGRIVTQVQAMPGYTNKLVYTFNDIGDYTLQCLEYCGLGHAPMKATLAVLAPGGD